MTSPFPEVLRQGIWHSTSVERWRSIQATGAILPNPKIPDSERWFASNGEKHYPVVRQLGGVSLFDFQNFDPVDYRVRWKHANWGSFVPYRTAWGASIWLDIDEDFLGPSYLSPASVEAAKNARGIKRGNYLPEIEAAYVGEIPTAAISAVLVASVQTGGAFLVYDPTTEHGGPSNTVPPWLEAYMRTKNRHGSDGT